MAKPENWADEYLLLISDCERRSSRMNDWDREFIKSLRSRIEKNRAPTKPQINKLDEIWEKVTRSG